MNKPTVSLVESLISKSHEYVETRLDLFKLKMIDKSSEAVSNIAGGIALFLVFFLVFIVLNIGIALLIGDLLGRYFWGFFIVAAIYAIIGLVLLKSKDKWIKAPIVSMFLHKFVKNSTSWDK